MSKQPSLIIKNITARIDDREVVKKVSLTVRPGELHVIMGINGSGKSSFLNAVMGHPKFSGIAGTIMLGKENIMPLSTNEKAKRGIFLSMQQSPSIDGITLAYFLHQSLKAIRGTHKPIMEFYREAQEKARELGISEELLDRPLHASLSGGEKKQSEILQLALHVPRFAFLDEIDSGVDIDALTCVWNGVEMCRKDGTGIVFVTHYPTIIKSVSPDYVHVMQDGTLIQSGGPELVAQIERDGFKKM